MPRKAPKIELSSIEATSADDVSSSGTFTNGAFEINRYGVVGSHGDRTRHVVALDDENHTVVNNVDELIPIRRLGQGASGTVELMQHPGTGRIVAVKHINVFDAGKRLQITKELETLFSAHHPNIVKFMGAFYSDGAISLVLEYMDAGSLGDVVQKYGPLPEGAIAKVAESVLLGLHYMHKTLHCVHRDLKPSNLLLNSRGEVKISDFGVSAQVAHTAAECATFVGTVTYMSPERISGGTYSSAADVWALGLSLVELALGEFPYKKIIGGRDITFWALLTIIRSQPAPSLPKSHFSEDFISFVDCCLRKDPADRPSCSELLNHPFIINNALNGVSVDDTVQSLAQNCFRQTRPANSLDGGAFSVTVGSGGAEASEDEIESLLAQQLTLSGPQ
eukprot:ANDGO_03829.mRNA.1 Mitogen-activated protein kinase kinase 1